MGSGWFDVLGSGWFDPQWGDPSGGGVSAPTFAMRADTPMVARDITPIPNPQFPLHGWDGDLYALTLLPDFLAATYQGVPWEKYIISKVGPPPDVILSGSRSGPDDLRDSIDELRIFAVTQRPEAMGEILNQNKKLQLCFMQLMMMTQTSHPRTYFILKIASRIGEVVMMRLKCHFDRPRPSQYCPTLYPPVPTPGHASYPAGHAVLAHLVASCLIEVTTPAGGVSPYAEALARLADDIGLNRVYAGLHFMSDINAGALAGKITHDILKSLPAPDPSSLPRGSFTYASAIQAAQAEWA
jgi:acid phosphatase (class A)